MIERTMVEHEADSWYLVAMTGDASVGKSWRRIFVLSIVVPVTTPRREIVSLKKNLSISVPVSLSSPSWF